jgi:hypothetical protein
VTASHHKHNPPRRAREEEEEEEKERVCTDKRRESGYETARARAQKRVQ